MYKFIQVNYKGCWIKIVFFFLYDPILHVLLQGLEHTGFNSVEQQRALGIKLGMKGML